MLNDLTIVLYSSTKGHFGFKNSYQFTVDSLMGNLGDDFFSIAKYCNVKREDGDNKVFSEMEDFLGKRGFVINQTFGDWSHNNNSHAKEYYKDMLNVFNKSYQKEFTLVIEDDWLINFEDSIGFNHALEIGISFLKKNKNALCIRVNSEPDCRTNGATEIQNGIYRQDEDFTPFGSTFTFQPTIVRTRDWWHSLRIINNNLHLLDSVHCEILSGQVFKQFSDDKSPFYFFDPDLVWCEHIGEKEKLEKLNGITNQ